MNMGDWQSLFSDLFNKHNLMNSVAALGIFTVGIFFARRLRNAISRITQLDHQPRLLLSKLSYYGMLFASLAAALSQMGVDVNVIVGAAGVLTVAVGFAAQTSASNLISGLFLMAEKPFVVGDVIAVGDTRGVVMSIDLLSTKIRTFNNLMVRIPNESLVKSSIANYSFFPLRRLDLNFNVMHNSDVAAVERSMRSAAKLHPLCLEDPQPVFVINGFGDFAIQVQLQVWTLAENLVPLQNDLYRDIKSALDQAGVQVPSLPIASTGQPSIASRH